MSLRFFLFVIGLGTLVVWFAWFYVLLGSACFGTTVLGGVSVRRLISPTGFVSRQVMEAFRHGILFSLLLLLSLLLLSFHVLSWWTISLLVLFLSLLELAFFITYKKSI